MGANKGDPAFTQLDSLTTQFAQPNDYKSSLIVDLHGETENGETEKTDSTILSSGGFASGRLPWVTGNSRWKSCTTETAIK